MTEIVVWQERAITESNVAEELSAQITALRLAAAVAKAGMDAVGEVHSYAAFRAVASLAASDAIRKQAAPAQGRSALDEAAYLLRNKSLLDALNRIAEMSGEAIVALADDLPLSASSSV